MWCAWLSSSVWYIPCRSMALCHFNAELSLEMYLTVTNSDPRWGYGEFPEVYLTVTPQTILLHWDTQQCESFEYFVNSEGQSHKMVSTNHNFWKERTVKAESDQSPSVYQPSTFPQGQTSWLNSWFDDTFPLVQKNLNTWTGCGWQDVNLTYFKR